MKSLEVGGKYSSGFESLSKVHMSDMDKVLLGAMFWVVPAKTGALRIFRDDFFKSRFGNECLDALAKYAGEHPTQPSPALYRVCSVGDDVIKELRAGKRVPFLVHGKRWVSFTKQEPRHLRNLYDGNSEYFKGKYDLLVKVYTPAMALADLYPHLRNWKLPAEVLEYFTKVFNALPQGSKHNFESCYMDRGGVIVTIMDEDEYISVDPTANFLTRNVLEIWKGPKDLLTRNDQQAEKPMKTIKARAKARLESATGNDAPNTKLNLTEEFKKVQKAIGTYVKPKKVILKTPGALIVLCRINLSRTIYSTVASRLANLGYQMPIAKIAIFLENKDVEGFICKNHDTGVFLNVSRIAQTVMLSQDAPDIEQKEFTLDDDN